MRDTKYGHARTCPTFMYNNKKKFETVENISTLNHNYLYTYMAIKSINKHKLFV